MLRIGFPVLLLWLAASAGEGRLLSTTKDGKFQAIAQAPDSISLYWKTDDPAPVILRNGAACTDLTSTVDPVTGFTTTTIRSLAPDTLHTFSLGQDGPSVAEKTWAQIPGRARYDVLVIGGTASGVSAAVTAARLGLKVALVEETNRLGGMASNGLGSTDIRNISRSNGFFEDFRRSVVAYYGQGNGLRYEPRVANAIIKDMVYSQPGITVFMKTEALRPIKKANRVLGAVVRGSNGGRAGELLARLTIDATYTADFAAAAGAPFRFGREARSSQEPHAGVLYFNDATQEILPGSTGKADRKQQSYSYLMVWKDYGEQGAPLIEQPRFYSPDVYRHSPPWDRTWSATSGKLPNNKYEINQHPFGTDWPCINHGYPTANRERRLEIEAMYRDRALGYLYYVQNELGHRNLGLADDEFLDNGNFPVSLYVREARRIVGEYWFTESDVTNARQFHRADSIAIGDYPMDSHATEDLKDPTAEHKGEGEAWLAKFTPWYQVPHGVIVPMHVDGLLVTTAVSASHWGFGTLRMEPVRMSLGQAAAALAYWSILYGKEPRSIRPAWVQDKILSQYAYINWNSDVSRDTRHFQAINFLGARGIFVNERFEHARPLTRAEALIVLNRMLVLEGNPRGLEISPLPDPNEPVTRGAFARWLLEAKLKSPDRWEVVRPGRASYTDVPPDAPHFCAVETLRARRITSRLFEDYQPGLFRPEAPISRGDAAEAIYLAHRPYAMNYWLP